jgi:IS30 family transposase
MKHRTRIQYTENQNSQMWDRWQQGESLHQIARLFDRHHSSVRGILAASGGIRPPLRKRSPRALTLAEREEISRGLMAAQSIRCIATSLGRSASTVSREVRRNKGPEGYRATQTDQAAWNRGRRPKTCKLMRHRTLARHGAGKLQRDGLRNKSPAGSNAVLPTRRTIRCHTKRSTKRCISSLVAR